MQLLGSFLLFFSLYLLGERERTQCMQPPSLARIRAEGLLVVPMVRVQALPRSAHPASDRDTWCLTHIPVCCGCLGTLWSPLFNDLSLLWQTPASLPVLLSQPIMSRLAPLQGRFPVLLVRAFFPIERKWGGPRLCWLVGSRRSRAPINGGPHTYASSLI